MSILILGLIVFLGIHSVRIVCEGCRARAVARWGEKPWKALHSVIALAGLALLVWGFALARAQPVLLWLPPLFLRHLNALFTLLAFVLVAAACVPGNQIKARLRHPMVLGVKLWALGHLLATHTLADAVLFGAFLLWAMLAFRAARLRDRASGSPEARAPGRLGATLAAVGAGVLAWAAFAFWLHGSWIGIAPFGI
ncbi:MAG: NnrU family protein [Burkholderiaceae bacterium]|jgi:uncharacterized membrane protein|nr:NnrU family protein [Burkholderiaceae bacterium]